MPNMVLPLLRNEITKTSRTRLPYFGLFAALMVCFLAYVVTGEITGQESNAWGYVSLSMQLVFTDIGLIFIAIFSAMLIAEETGFGTVRTVLSAPILRWELYLAKAAAGILYAGIMLIFSLILSVCLSLVHYRFGDVRDSMGLIYGQKEVLGNLIFALFLSWIPLAAVVTYALFISTIVRKPGQAVAVTIGTIYIVDFTKHIVGIDAYIFTRYISFPWQVFNQISQGISYQWTPEIWKMLALSLLTCLITFAAGLALFAKRDLNT